MADAQRLIDAAHEIADEHLFPRANDVDRAGVVPVEQLDLLADAGLYGLFTPSSCGGLGVDRATIETVTEILAGGCLTTAFVWTQHGGPARASCATEGPMRERWAHDLSSGRARGGVAFAHLLREGDPLITAASSEGGWLLDGVAPFVTGWGHVDVMLVAARHGDDVVWAMVDAVESSTMTAERLHLAAVDSSVTAAVTFAGHHVDDAQVTHREPFATWHDSYHQGLRANGSLALGITSRCVRLLGPSEFDDQLIEARRRLDSSPNDEMPRARSAASTLAVRASSALVAAVGGSGVQLDRHAQRLAREAMFLLVQGQTAEIRRHNIDLLTRRPI